MKILQPLAIIIFLLSCTACFGQASLTLPVNLQATYTKGTRTPMGPPGKNYWQNAADYDIKVTFVPQTRVLTGSVKIDYTNNSPDTLTEIHFKLYPNLYKKGSIRNMVVKDEDLTDGVQITQLSLNKQVLKETQRTIDGTNMVVKIPELLPKQTIQFEVAYSYTLNGGSHIRTGQVDSGAFFIAYFFPRVAVYDDIDGWNRHHYQGTQEFYNDFSHFKAEITVPGNYEVWATGNLKNTDEIYTDKIAKRISEASLSDKVTNIIYPEDLRNDDITQNKTSNTWKFEADSVTDMAFAISNHYLWKASSLVVDPKTARRTRVDAVFNPKHKDFFDVIDYARKTVEAMSFTFPAWPYPFPHETVFDGLDQMEYPMMVNDAPYEKAEDDIELTDHEIFHTMFPFYMGINETKYAWMDEGWATLGEWVISSVIDPKIHDHYAIGDYENNAGKEEDPPIATLSTQLGGVSYQTNSYPKPALGYLYVKDMLGDVLFTKALHYYIAQWHGKHPMPYDFFSCINTGSGVNLNWFWKSWFFDNGVPDLGISRVTVDKKHYTIFITKIGSKPVPVNLTLFYKDGTTEVMHQSIACWKSGNKNLVFNINAKKRIDKMILGNGYDADIDKSNNVWIAQ